jgi:hypothetical protein
MDEERGEEAGRSGLGEGDGLCTSTSACSSSVECELILLMTFTTFHGADRAHFEVSCVLHAATTQARTHRGSVQ